jgi:hypothetical protein
MALTINIPGGNVQLSGNRVQIEITTDTITGEMYNLLLKTTSADDSFPEGIDAIEPDDDNKAIFDIRNRVTLPIVYSFTWPLIAQVAVEQSQMAKLVQLDIGERYVDQTSGENVDTVNWAGLEGSAYEVLILKGGISKHQQAKYNEQGVTFFSEIIQAGLFLTELPDNMQVKGGQPVKLWYITPELTAQSLILEVNYIELDGTPGSLEHAVTVNPGTMTEICADTGDLGLDASNILSYSVQLKKSDLYASEQRTFRVINRYYENNNFILYANRLGGIDCLWFTGHFKKLHPTESEISNRDARITDTQQRPTIDVDYKSGRRAWEINTGYKREEEIKALSGLFESRNVWLLDGNDIIPLIITDGENELLNSAEDIHSVTITFREAH